MTHILTMNCKSSSASFSFLYSSFHFGSTELAQKMDIEENTQLKVDKITTLQVQEKVKLYPTRWWILLTVVFTAFSNMGHWMSFGSVTKIAALYYDQSGDKIDFITLVSALSGMPSCILAPIIFETFGLKVGLWTAGVFNVLGKFNSKCLHR